MAGMGAKSTWRGEWAIAGEGSVGFGVLGGVEGGVGMW